MLHVFALSTTLMLLPHDRFHCAIEDGDEVVLTGGHICNGPLHNPLCQFSTGTVTKYNVLGPDMSLPSLTAGRHHHACGSFTDSNGAKV